MQTFFPHDIFQNTSMFTKAQSYQFWSVLEKRQRQLDIIFTPLCNLTIYLLAPMGLKKRLTPLNENLGEFEVKQVFFIVLGSLSVHFLPNFAIFVHYFVDFKTLPRSKRV